MVLHDLRFPYLVFVELLAFWPVWTWYVATLRDPANDTSVVIALFTAAFFCVVKKPVRQGNSFSLRIPIIVLFIYIVTFPWLPPFGHAVLAVITVSYTLNRWRFGNQPQPWLYGLLLMALPVLTPMYVYLAYPLRLIVGKLAVLFLQPFGVPVFFEGIAFNWDGQYIWSDELCSGVRKLWAGGGFTFALAAFYNFKLKGTLFLVGWAAIAFITANVLRTMFLVYMYGAFPVLPWWAHRWEGPLMFLVAALAIVGVAQMLQKAESTETGLEKNLDKKFATLPISLCDLSDKVERSQQ